MPWYNSTNFHRKGGDHMKAEFTLEKRILGVSWRLIVGTKERTFASLPHQPPVV